MKFLLVLLLIILFALPIPLIPTEWRYTWGFIAGTVTSMVNLWR